MEQELRNKVKEAAKEYYKEVYGAKRKFDYTFSDYALKASKPWKIETIIDKFVDRTYSFKFQVFGMYSKVTLAELYYVLRKSPVKTKCDARKKEILGDFNK